MPAFAPAIPRPDKRTAGKTDLPDTPMSIRGNIELGDQAKRRLRAKLGRALSPMATRIERVSVRFDDVNGPRGGVATRCRTKVVLSGKDSVVVEERGRNPTHAVALVTPVLRRTLKRTIERRGGKTPAPSRTPSATKKTKKSPASAPERAPRRTIKKRTHGMTAALEAPSDDPSRKSTRGSANRAKAGSKLGRAAKRRKLSPTKRHTRGK